MPIGETIETGWVPQRLRAARAAMRDHGRPVSQQRFAALIGVSKRTLERYESLTDPQPPKPAALVAITQVTGRPAEHFFGAAPPPVADSDDFEAAIAQMFVLALRPLTARLTRLEREAAERTTATARRAA